MIFNARLPINALDGTALPADTRQPNGERLCLGIVFCQAMLAASHPPGSWYGQSENLKRYEAARTIYQAMRDTANPMISLDITEIAWLRADITRLYGPIVVGQVLPLLDEEPEAENLPDAPIGPVGNYGDAMRAAPDDNSAEIAARERLSGVRNEGA